MRFLHGLFAAQTILHGRSLRPVDKPALYSCFPERPRTIFYAPHAARRNRGGGVPRNNNYYACSVSYRSRVLLAVASKCLSPRPLPWPALFPLPTRFTIDAFNLIIAADVSDVCVREYIIVTQVRGVHSSTAQDNTGRSRPHVTVWPEIIVVFHSRFYISLRLTCCRKWKWAKQNLFFQRACQIRYPFKYNAEIDIDLEKNIPISVCIFIHMFVYIRIRFIFLLLMYLTFRSKLYTGTYWCWTHTYKKIICTLHR